MADLIDRAPMLEFLDLQHYDKDMLVSQYSPDWIYSWLESQPTIDAKPVVHSLWVGGRFRLIDGVYEERCLRCGEWSDEYDKPFCPNCGADMRERKET
jgi:hypothetical protein